MVAEAVVVALPKVPKCGSDGNPVVAANERATKSHVNMIYEYVLWLNVPLRIPTYILCTSCLTHIWRGVKI